MIRKLFIFVILSVFMLTGCAFIGFHTKDQDIKDSLQADTAKGEEISENARVDIQERGMVTSSAEGGKDIIKDATKEIKDAVFISSFKYAPKEFCELLIIYLEMQNAYIEEDLEGLNSLKEDFQAKFKKTQKLTVEGKENDLERLRQEIAQKKQQIQRQGEDAIFEVYPTIYVVKGGDTLPSIAARHELYNDSYMWPLIYKANRDQIKDPQIIYSGQDLKIPRDMSIEEIIGARREAGAPEPEKLPKDAFVPRR